ncbi:unnamed protein product [Lepeophtheirus salmonis]|uniref:(salmon louse) hypothetical protein n=1 Tax=Lepeophtheirus salmonis TaxID=72036 RepID=A0A7R8CCL2_LEPSM|nr:unnamed protein product [Lepeophtheirus salmonis]CAF2772397.1 unnamed protein product [Lepeophtheirus salmonis]
MGVKKKNKKTRAETLLKNHAGESVNTDNETDFEAMFSSSPPGMNLSDTISEKILGKYSLNIPLSLMFKRCVPFNIVRLDLTGFVRFGPIDSDVFHEFDEALYILLKKIPRIRELFLKTHEKFTYIPKVRNHHMYIIGNHCVHLEVLDISYNKLVTGEGLKYLLNCKELRKLYLFKVSTSEHEVVRLLDSLPNLECHIIEDLNLLILITQETCPDIKTLKLRVKDEDLFDFSLIESVRNVEFVYNVECLLRLQMNAGQTLSELTVFMLSPTLTDAYIYELFVELHLVALQKVLFLVPGENNSGGLLPLTIETLRFLLNFCPNLIKIGNIACWNRIQLLLTDMGQRLSCLCDCCRAQESGGDGNERTRLLTPSSGVGGEFHSEGGSEEGFGYSFNVEGSLDVGESGDSELGDRPSEEGKAEQTALSKILHDAAHELIDVSGATLQSAAVSSSLENHEFAERAQDYSIKLFLAAPNLALKYNEDTLSTDNWTDGFVIGQFEYRARDNVK